VAAGDMDAGVVGELEIASVMLELPVGEAGMDADPVPDMVAVGDIAAVVEGDVVGEGEVEILPETEGLAEIAKDVGEGDQLYAGIGFGTQLWEQIAKEHKISPPEGILHFKEKKGKLGSMPASGGDIFVHVKAKNISQCYEVIHQFISSLPAGSVASVDDEYGWHFQDGRDLSGFIDGTENVADAVKRREYGLLPSGGSYAIHQRWIHDIKSFEKLPVEEQEKIVGRSKPDSARLSALPKDSHVARSRDDKDNQIPIIRQSMPFGPAKGPRGLLFIAYANSPARFDVLLDRMTGKGGSDDRIMSFSKCVASQYYYIPSLKELASLK